MSFLGVICDMQVKLVFPVSLHMFSLGFRPRSVKITYSRRQESTGIIRLCLQALEQHFPQQTPAIVLDSN